MVSRCRPFTHPTATVLVSALLQIGFSSVATAEDWPMWRYDAGRSAASPNQLADQLHPQWTRPGTARLQAWDDPLNLDLMTYDRLFEPIVLDGRMFIGHSDRDKLSAIDVANGEELWAFYTDAPVRLPPVGWRDRVYFTSDDGHLYCVDAASGKLHWQYDATAGPRKVIGNRRLTSAWPARGGPVIFDDTVYFASSIWPFMGVFIQALDTETGELRWINDSAGSSYIKQPHSAPSFAGVGPQGALVATEKDLIVPGGRSVPAVFDRASGELRYFELNAGGKGTGGSFVCADDDSFFVHTRLKGVREFALKNGKKGSFQPNEPVLHQGLVYSGETAKDGSAVIRAYDAKRKPLWEIAADGRGDLILADDKLYAAGPDGLFAIRLPADPDGQPQIVWTADSPGDVQRLLAACGRLLAVTLDGDIIAYGEQRGRRKVAEKRRSLKAPADAAERAGRLLAASDAEGFALWYGAGDGALIGALAGASPFDQLAVIDADADRVDAMRRRLDAAGLYGAVTAHQGDPVSFDASPYIAHMVFVGSELSGAIVDQRPALAAAYQSVRPYGGVLHLIAEESQRQEIAAAVRQAKLEQAEVEVGPDGVIVRRVGQLPGAADWTHQHGDIANTRKSNDTRVKLPLGILWFGGSSHMDVLPRHGHGPPQQVVGGRLFIQGVNVLSARDVYSGRVLWRREFEDLGTYDVYYDDTYAETPLDPSYNQVHIPGANARGTNFVVTADRVYIVEGAVCRVLDPATGETIQTIELTQEDPDDPHEWSYIGVYEDVLIGGLGFARYRDRLEISFDEEDADLKRNRAGFGSKSLDRAGSLALVGFDRISGEQLWRVDARHSFWNNGIVAGRGMVYGLDKNPKPVEDKLRRRGIAPPDSYRIVAFDARTGEQAWQVEEGIFGTWLGYSEPLDLLLQAGAAASDRLSVEVDTGMTVYQGRDGTVRWSKPDLKYSGPCILHNDVIITNANSYRMSAGAFYLSDGEPYQIVNPLTGQQEHWKLTRAYGCNTILASENLLTFRSGAAGFYDLTTHSGTGNFGGFKSGCTGNLIVADGVLNAPDYTRTCSCAYQNQTSLALVHMPQVETWTVNTMVNLDGDQQPLNSLGVNLGAPGAQRSPEGILWVESPNAAGDEPSIDVIVRGDNIRYFRRHSSAMAGSEYPWIFASGIEGEADIRLGTQVGGERKDGDDQDDAETAEPVRYQARLFFAAPAGGPQSGRRSFDVLVDDQPLLEGVTIEDGGHEVRQLEITAAGSVRLRLSSHDAAEAPPVLSGIELQRLAQ